MTVSLYGGNDNLDQSNTSSVTFRGGPGGAFDPGSDIGSTTAGEISNTDVSEWGNRGASARWFRQWAARFSSDALVATSTYRSTADRSSTATLAAASGRAGTLGRPSFDERNTVDDITLRLDNELLAKSALNLDFGAWVTHNTVRYDYEQLRADTVVGGIARSDAATQASAYVQTVWSPLSLLALTAGVRSTHYDLTAKTYFEPRVQANVRVTDAVQLKGAWGKYRQFVNQVENEDVLNGSRDFWLLADSTLPSTAAEHRIVGVSVDLPTYLFSVEAYDKILDGVSIFSRRFRRVSFAADYNHAVLHRDRPSPGDRRARAEEVGALTAGSATR